MNEMQYRRQQVNDAVNEILQNKKYGDVLDFDYLESLIGYERFEGSFFIIFAAVREVLIEYGYVLSNIINEGYRILFPNEVAEEVISRYLKGAHNRLKKGLKVMRYTDRKALNEQELRNFEGFENIMKTAFQNNQASLLMAQAKLNSIKQKELEG